MGKRPNLEWQAEYDQWLHSPLFIPTSKEAFRAGWELSEIAHTTDEKRRAKLIKAREAAAAEQAQKLQIRYLKTLRKITESKIRALQDEITHTEG